MRRSFRFPRQYCTSASAPTSHHATPIPPPIIKSNARNVTNDASSTISPLLQFESASLHYPQAFDSCDTHDNYDDSIDTNYDLGLEADMARFHPDFLLETRDASCHARGDGTPHSHTQQFQRQFPNPLSHRTKNEPLLESIDMRIYPNSECGSGGGGHLLLGKNAAGKTLISRAIHQHPTHSDNPYLHSGTLRLARPPDRAGRRHRAFLSHVSFESHARLLARPRPATVHRTLIPGGGNRLSPAAQFLSVRLGMYPLLPRFVDTLSTGQIRRVLLVRALVERPALLLLDNVMDGLDGEGRRGVREILKRVLEGFRMDILVQGVGNARDTARTQIFMASHRPEEVLGGMGSVSFVGGGRVRTESRGGRSGLNLLKCLEFGKEHGTEEEYDDFVRSLVDNQEDASDSGESSHPWEGFLTDPLPSKMEINNFWESGNRKNAHSHGVLIEAKKLKVIRDDTVLLSDLQWTVQRGERWHLAGTNGAGKSTLGRLLLRKSVNNYYDCDTNDAVIADGRLEVTKPIYEAPTKRGGIGWVSTELHLHAAHHWSDRTVSEILSIGAGTLFDRDKSSQLGSANNENYSTSSVIDIESFTTVLHWLGLINHNSSTHTFLTRSFGTLSQGQQKLLLIASAIAQKPSLLILDEPCQGLDLWNRAKVLHLLHSMCCTTDMSLIYITHHEEELIPSIEHRIRLEDGKVVFCGALESNGLK